MADLIKSGFLTPCNSLQEFFKVVSRDLQHACRPFFYPPINFNGKIAPPIPASGISYRYTHILRSVITDKPTPNAAVSHSPAKSRFSLKRSIFLQIIGPRGVFPQTIPEFPTSHNFPILTDFDGFWRLSATPQIF